MACARWHHAAPTGLAEISVGAGYKHVAPLGLVSFGGRPPSPTMLITGGGPVVPSIQQRRNPAVQCMGRVGPAP